MTMDIWRTSGGLAEQFFLLEFSRHIQARVLSPYGYCVEGELPRGGVWGSTILDV